MTSSSQAGFFTTKIRSLRDHLQDPLYRNGYALMLNTALTSGLGFVFLTLAAHTYSTEVVGRNTAQIAAMMLVSSLTQVNFTSVLVRFLPRAGRQSARLITFCYAVAAAMAIVGSVLFLSVTHVVTDVNSAMHVSFGFAVAFTFATAAWSIFNLQDGTMTGLRKAIWVPVENGFFNVGKIVFLFALAGIFGDATIFAATAIPVALTLIPVNWAIFKRFIPQHIEATSHREQQLESRLIGRYVAGDYVSTLFVQAMTTLMPVLVVAILGTTANAAFYVAQTMGMALDLIAYNLANSLTVEAAGREDRIVELTRAVLKKVLTLVLPLALFMFIAAPWLLGIFGQEYRDEATTLLRLLVLASIPKVVISIHSALARLHHKTYRNAIFTSIQAILLVGGSIVMMKKYGINGVGYAAIISQTFVALLVLPWMIKVLHHRKTA